MNCTQRAMDERWIKEGRKVAENGLRVTNTRISL